MCSCAKRKLESMSDAGTDDAGKPVLVDQIIVWAVRAAARRGIVLGERDGGDINSVTIAAWITDAVHHVMPIRGDPEQLKKAPPWHTMSKRAAELHRFPQVVPFAHRELINHKHLEEPHVINVRGIAPDMPTRRDGVGRKRPGLIAIAQHQPQVLRPAGWSPIDFDHVVDPARSAGELDLVELPLRRLVEGLLAAHPYTPIVIEPLYWPHRTDGVYAYDTRYSDIGQQLRSARAGQLIFSSQAPINRLHFDFVDGSDKAPRLLFRGKDLPGGIRLIEMQDAFGIEHYYTTTTSVSYRTAAHAIAKTHADDMDLERFGQRFGANGVLFGNATSGAAVAARAACVQVSDLLVDAGINDFAGELTEASGAPPD